MAATYSSPNHQQIPFPSSPLYSSLGFSFGGGNSISSASGSASTPTKQHQPSTLKKSLKKREFNDEEDTKMSIGDDDGENRPVRTLKKVKSTLNTNVESEEGDVGVLLASLPRESLLNVMNNVINQEPSIKHLIMNKIPQPTISTYLNALNDSTCNIIQSIPIGHSRPTYTLRPISNWTKVISTYLPFFTSNGVHVTDKFIAIQPTTVEFIKVISRLPTLTNDEIPQSLSGLWDKLRKIWSDWFEVVDAMVNREGGMFSSSVVNNWAKGLDEICKSGPDKPLGFNHSCQVDLINLRQNWETRLGWLIARDITPRPEWAA
ncbi:hypothetical protein E3P92_01643 [Wallemia ichthyophaga]|uniref:Tethering factor for nuclear proteasome STS1 n=1 Tax=Wallemia ichthyophaga TaxID=245174 RepID=A0A4T0I492_WALIC|nr:hypothetical protein E3P90_02171 [Wallemia ichthyophaga]TIB13317.1 hypothetical protein E3P93_02008 [Wallemia ichthyophaga]TIB15467.1 hypothetical protein E3P92_01643 [Wallemia ichthyophaga]TIB23033.1 hypothetical protein E3P89_01779 [Wallemia ichthyophaga]TIB24308.1 hypothetical protein E3P88_02126 [Wallemia ichthyophaga]